MYVYLGLYKYIMSYIYISADPRELGGARQRSNAKYAKSKRKAALKKGLHHIVLLSFLIIVNVIFDYPPTPGN